MTSAELLSGLGMILERESPERDFPIPERLFYLNRSQRFVAGELPLRFVRPLETVSSAKAVNSTGGVSLSLPTHLTYAALGAPATTGLIGDTGQGLSAVNDVYNGAVLYSVGYNSCHVVTDYVGSTRTFTVSPAATGNFGASETKEFYFVTPDFGLNSPILNGDRGISWVRHSSGYYCAKILDDERREIDENSITLPDSSPGFFIEGTTLYVRPYTYGTTTVTLYYKKVPPVITSSVTCILDENIQDMIVDYAGYLGLMNAKQYNAAGGLRSMVLSRINELVNREYESKPVRMEVAQFDNRGSGLNIRTMR